MKRWFANSAISRIPLWLRLAGMALCVGAAPASALTPPRPGELQQYAEDGTLAARQDWALRNGNHLIAEQLLNAQLARMHAGESPRLPPEKWRGGLPSKGTVKTLTVLVDFADYRATQAQTVDEISSKMFGAGNAGEFPYESLRSYYSRASYGQLDITGNVLGWYHSANNRSHYENLGEGGVQTLIKEVLSHYEQQGHDFSQYDNDGDGYIDSFFIKWTGPDSGWGGFWWAYQSTFSDTQYLLDGKRLRSFVWSWYSNPEQENGVTSYTPRTDIHETGHLLGLPDYYDYDEAVGPKGGVGGLDMMDANLGDHNCFSKLLLEWVTPTVLGSNGLVTRPFAPSGTTGDCVLVMPGATNNYFGEYFLVQYRRNAADASGGNDHGYPADGLTIWHVDAALDASGTDYLFNNSTTAHKLLRLMEADGLEQLEQGGSADAGDLYVAGRSLGDATAPNSRNYGGQATQVSVDNIGSAGATLTARIGIGAGTSYTLSVNKYGSGTVTSTPAGISCGSSCSYSFSAGTPVTLVATPAAGFLFGGWSGACNGTGSCQVTLAANSSVTASFVAGDVGGDLNGDGKGDILWYNANLGRTDAWLMNGVVMTAVKTLLVYPGWEPVVQGDFNGDGKADILWYNAAVGATDLWLMNGTSRLQSARLLTNPAWRPVAAGDLDGDGKDDILWYNAVAGATDAWLMNGMSRTAGLRLLTNPGWKPVALADMNGDYKADILWYNASAGATDGWLMNGLSKSAGIRLLTNTSWRPLGMGDLNGDHMADILWYNAAAGATDAWLMNGLSRSAGARLLTYPGWKPAAVSDVNGDGRADILWNNAGSGATDIWLMNGLSKTQSKRLFTGSGWTPVGFRD